MLSHDTRLRCDLVDLYYALYGSRRPVCLPIPELAALMSSQKQDLKKPIPHIAKPTVFENQFGSGQKESIPIVADENLECMNVEVVAGNSHREELLEMHVDNTKELRKQDYFSDNSVSLPGMGQSGPIGFEPGMFKKETDGKHRNDANKIKKKKKDKKKHKHKHKHKHEHRHNKDRKDKDLSKKIKEETLSSVSSTPSPNPILLGGETI